MRHIMLTAEMLYTENVGAYLKTAWGTFETYLFIDRAYIKGKSFQRQLFDSGSYLCSDIWCLFLPMPELLIGFKKGARAAKLACLATADSNKY